MLRFHEIHGNNIQLEEEEHKAVRNSQDSFCDGVTFRLALYFFVSKAFVMESLLGLQNFCCGRIWFWEAFIVDLLGQGQH